MGNCYISNSIRIFENEKAEENLNKLLNHGEPISDNDKLKIQAVVESGELFKYYLFTNKDFQKEYRSKFGNKQATPEEIVSTCNLNKLYNLIEDYKTNVMKKLEYSKNARQEDTLMGFQSSAIKEAAIDWVSSLIVSELVGSKNLSSKQLIDRTISAISNKYKELILDLKQQKIKDKKTNILYDEVLDVLKRIEEQTKAYDELYEKYDPIRTKYDECFTKNGKVKKGVTDETLDELEKQLDEIEPKLDEIRDNIKITLTNEFYNKASDLIESLPSNIEHYHKYKAFAAIINNIRFNEDSEENEFLRKCVNRNALRNLSIDFSYSIKNLDASTAFWEHSVAQSYEDTVDSDTRLYLNSIKKLSRPFNYTVDQQTYERSNGLEEAINYTAANLIILLETNCDLTSVETFINSLREMSVKNPFLYGAGQIVKDCENNDKFARQIWTGLSNFKISKTRLSLNEEKGFNNFKSNEASDLLTSIVNTMFNNITRTYSEFYTNDRINRLNAIYKALYKLNRDKVFDFTLSEDTAAYKSFVKETRQLLSEYFPSIDNSVINTLLVNDRYNSTKNALNIISKLISLENKIKAYKDREDIIRDDKIREQKDAFKNSIDEFETGRTHTNENVPKTTNYTNENSKALKKAILDLAEEFKFYLNTHVELNSVNAEGNLSSDLIPNSLLTNIMKQFDYVDKLDIQRGLLNYGEFMAKSTQFRHNPVLFGVKKADGTIDKKGIFNIGPDGEVTIADYDLAKQVLNIELFNGAQKIGEKGVLYDGFSGTDYLITKMSYFASILNNEDTIGKYFLRTPSDAGKNFTTTWTKYKASKDVNSTFFNVIRGFVTSEIETFVENLNCVFDRNNDFYEREDKSDLIDDFHTKRDKKTGEVYTIKDGKLVGNIFRFQKLFGFNTFNFENAMMNLLDIYGENGIIIKENGKYKLNPNHNLLNIKVSENGDIDSVSLKNLNIYSEAIDNLISEWINNYEEFAKNEFNKHSKLFDELRDTYNDNTFSQEEFFNYLINESLAYMAFDDVFEGSYAFYGNPITHFKRAKENQMGGIQNSGFNIADKLGGDIVNLRDKNNNNIKYTIAGRTFNITNGFKAICVENTIKGSESAEDYYHKLYNVYKNKGFDDKTAKEYAENIAKGFGYNNGSKSKINDAQSYITFDEFIKRRYLDGTIHQYESLIEEILTNPKDINIFEFNKKIQVQKNVYFDHINTNVHGVTITKTRQIKNAEFVLIKELLPKDSDLVKLHDFMVENEIGQLNTRETSKASNQHVLTLWDNDGVFQFNSFKNKFNGSESKYAENFYYRFLYKQEDIVDHLIDEENKAGMQIVKKIIDNLPLDNEDAKTFQTLFSTNIKESYNDFLKEMHWTEEDVNNGTFDFTEFINICRKEAERLGLNDNVLEYFETDVFGNPKMPNYMPVVAKKIENIVQSIFNNRITRQTLPGWHATQVTRLGSGYDLKYRKDNNYCEIAVGRNSKLIPKGYDLKKLQEEGLDEVIIYRIPTEGKQSVCVAKIVAIVDDTYGSTVFVPDEWVTQTGADFDRDSVYAITKEMYKTKDDKGKTYIKRVDYIDGKDTESTNKRYIAKINELFKNDKENKVNDLIKNENDRDKKKALKEKYDKNTIEGCKEIAKLNEYIDFEDFSNLPVEEQNTRAARNTKICESFINILLNDDLALEETLGRSHFEDLTKAKDFYTEKRSKLAYQETKEREVADVVEHETTVQADASVYNPITQVENFVKAMSGRELKAISVNRDTFNSVCNRMHIKLAKNNGIKVLFENEEKTFDKIAWNETNRNEEGRLITSYSSQTTAHILDAIKEGIIPNENKYTFGVFKTLVDVGLTYDIAVGFIMQPAIDYITEAYNEINSIYSKEKGDVIKLAEKKLLMYYKSKGLDIDVNDSTYISNDYIVSVLDKLKLNTSDKLIVKDLHDRFDIDVENITDIEELKKAFIHDLSAIILFREYKKISNKIEACARIARPDSFGADQTVFNTKQIVNRVEEKRGKTGLVSDINDKDFIDALYPLDEKGNINEKESLYPSLSSFFKYSTQASVKINTNFLEIEGDYTDYLLDVIEYAIGRPLKESEITKEKEYTTFKNYLLNCMFNKIPILVRPTYITNSGFAIPDITGNTELEIARIFGYNQTVQDGFQFKDINNPTTEELETFNNMTVLQKVEFIQRAFPNEDNICNYLYTRKVNNYGKDDTSLKHNLIQFKENGNENDLIRIFSNSFYNKNNLIRSAAIDLIKYAFLVEGFNFKKGSISRLIPNSAIKGKIEDKGLNIISKLENIFKNKTIDAEGFTMQFVRSHIDLIDDVKFYKYTSKKGSILKDYQVRANREYNQFIKNIKRLGDIEINNNAENRDIIRKLGFGFEEDSIINVPEFIKVTIDNKTKLYGAKLIHYPIVITDEEGNSYESDGEKIYLYPLNILESNEVLMDSFNDKNNVNPKYTIFKKIYGYLIDNATIESFANSLFYGELINDKTATAPTKHRFTKNSVSINSIEINRSDLTSDNVTRQIFENFCKKIEKGIERYGKYDAFYIEDQTFNISNLFGKASVIVQNININGEIVPVRLTRRFGLNDSIKNSEYALEEAQRKSVQKPTVYKVEIINNDTESTKRSSAVPINGLFNDDEGINTYGDLTSDINLAQDIYLDLGRRSYNLEDPQAKELLDQLNKKGINAHTLQSLKDNKADIYKIAADYYRLVCDDLKRDMESFTVYEDGVEKKFNIGDKNLYRVIMNDENNKDAYVRLLTLILEAKSIANRFTTITNVDVTAEDEQMQKNIDSIKKSISDIRNNPSLQKAMDNIWNEYLVKLFSTNPNLRFSITNITDVYNGTSFFDHYIGDVADLDHKQIQLVVNEVNNHINEASIKAQDIAEQFLKDYDTASKGKDINFDKLIDEHGKFKEEYNEDFINDRKALKEKVEKAKIERDNALTLNYDENKDYITKSIIDYEKARLEKDKWLLENTKQKLVDSFYKRYNEIREKVLKDIPELYAKYLYLSSDKEKNEKQLQELFKLYDTDGYTFTKVDNYDDIVKLNEFKRDRISLMKAHYESTESDIFENNKNKYVNVIKRYDEAYPLKTIEEKLNDSKEYKEAYDWLRANAVYSIDPTAMSKIMAAYSILKRYHKSDDFDYTTKIDEIIKSIPKSSRVDIYGNIIGTLYSDEQIKQLRKLELERLYGTEDSYNKDIYLSDLISEESMIKETTPSPIYLSFVKAGRNNGFNLDDYYIKAKAQYIKRINAILKLALDKGSLNTFKISSELLFRQSERYSKDKNLLLTVMEQEVIDSYENIDKYILINELKRLYKGLNELNNDYFGDEEVSKKLSLVHYPKLYNDKAYAREAAWAKTNLNDYEYNLWKSIFAETTTYTNKKGVLITKTTPSFFIFGKYDKSATELIDEDRTKARDFINKHVTNVPTQYYYKAAEEARLKGEDEYQKWFDLNHIYDTYQHKFVPLRIWTKREYVSSEELNLKEDWIPNFENTITRPKLSSINTGYDEFGSNYNGSARYASHLMDNLTEEEKAVYDLLRKTCKTYSSTKAAKYYFGKGYAPKKAKENIDGLWYLKQVGSIFGLAGINRDMGDWHDTIDYTHDFETPMDYLSDIKSKGMKKEKEIELKPENFNTRKEYDEYVLRINKENEQIRKENEELEKAYIDRNYKDVFKEFVQNAIIYNAKKDIKPLMYLTIEDLKSRKRYVKSSFKDSFIKNKRYSVDEETAYNEEGQEDTLDLFVNYARRIMFDEFKKPNKLNNVSNILQNISSTKYMQMNFLGGITNITAGYVNIIGDQFAHIIPTKDLWFGEKEYFKGGFNFIVDWFKENPSCIQSALVKRFNVVDFEDMTQRKDNETAAEWAKRIRDFLYSPQSMGEHHMQNVVMFAMMNQYKIYTDAYTGKTTIGRFEDYISGLEYKAFYEMIKDDKVTKQAFEQFKKLELSDQEKRAKYDNFDQNIVTNFIKGRENRIELIKKFNEVKKGLKETAHREFDNLENIYSQYEFNNGKLSVKNDSKLNTRLEGEFRSKVIARNKLLHGVYDKVGAAKIESTWWGNLAMQYHKHIYPGFMKRYRKHGYWNEGRSEIEKGSYVSAINILSLPLAEYSNKKAERYAKYDNAENPITMQQKVVESIGAIVDSLMDLDALQFNWYALSDFEKANALKTLGDICGIIASIALATGIRIAYDDDEIKNDKTANTMLFIADKFFGESRMYFPLGAISEAKTLWSSPVAAQNTITDAFKALTYITESLVDPDFNMVYDRGIYKGENKLAVVFLRNIPIVRVKRRFDNITKNNNYYRIGDVGYNMGISKHVAAFVKD